MSRISKWKLEKTKVKVVFRLQFHATHIPQTGWDKLFISFIPSGSGKATAKTNKANVRNGTCKWADPIYETTRLLQDSKSRQYDEKLYEIVVAMGTSRASTLGEATINLADYVEALKPYAVTLPLHGCNFGTILHITVQLLTSKTGFREFEQQRELRERGIEAGPSNDQNDKTGSRVKSTTDGNELSPLEEEVNPDEESADSATGFDGLSNTSGSLYEKLETSSTHEIDTLKSTMSGDLHVLSHCQSPHTVKPDQSDHHNTASTGSAKGWGSDISIDTELASEAYDRLRGSLELAESSFSYLKLEVSSLQSVADDLGAEAQMFSQQLAAEISSSEELAKEVSVMKTECLKFKDDIIRLKDLNLSRLQVRNPETSENQVDHLVQNIQLQLLKGITVMESKIRELQGKKYLIPHDGEANFFFLELEALLDFLVDLKMGNGEMTKLLNAIPSETVDVKEITELNTFKDDKIVISGNGLGLDLCEPENILQNFSMIPPESEAANHLGAVDAMEGQILDLVRELDAAKVEKEALTRKMNQMECYYEALIHELEENQKCMLGELQHLRNEHSTCLYSLSVSKSETESLRHDMNHQRLQFVDERHELEALNKELERRATTSNAALRRARLNYSIAVDKLQKDLQLLSSQIISMFETNANLIKQAVPAQLHSRGDLILAQNPKDGDVTKVSGFLDQSSRSMGGGEILMEDLKRSLCMQEEHYQKVEKELNEIYSINLNLDIYSIALQESLCEADADIRIMKGKMDEHVEELKCSAASQSQLLIMLQKATDNIDVLNEYKYSSISQYCDMTLQNQLLEDKLMSTSEENYLLVQKLNDLESSVMEYRSCQSKYEACLVENAELSLRLKQEGSENEKLTKEISFLKETLTILKSESDGLVSFKENLERSINFVQNKLANLLASYNRQFCFMDNPRSPNLEIVDVKDAIFQLEKTHHNVCVQYRELMEENQNLKGEKAIADVSLSTFISEIQTMKQMFRSGIEDMVSKLAVSNALIEKLQDELESVVNKLHLSSEIEEKYAHLNEVLLDDFALLESQLQDLTSKKGHVAQELLSLDSLADELERNELTISKLTQDKQELAMCLQEKTEETIKLVREMREERVYKDKLEGKLANLTFHLNKDQDKLLLFEQQKSELMHIRELASDFESEKSRLAHLLDQNNAFIDDYKRSNQAGFESQLLEMHDYLLATDVKLIYVANHYEALTEELVQKLVSSDSCVKQLWRRYNDMDAMLNQCLAGEANWREEKSNLFTSLESLRYDLDVSEAQNKLLSDSNNEIRDHLEEYKSKLTMMEVNFSSDSMLQASGIERLKNMLIDAEDKISDMAVSQEEIQILAIVLKSKIHEQSASITSLEEYKDELTIIRSQCHELSHKLTEQVLKTEEFKNLSTHLKELKDKAESECLLAHGKRETEVTYNAGQDSLRMAFIKEQYETQVQELKQQVSIAKKHGEEMLLKLQDAIDEIENRKRSEAVNSKKNKELVLRLSTLEAELRTALTEKREKSNACDRTKAELECALLSLECCKEEKGKLESSLLKFEAEKSQLAIEVNVMKVQLENLESSTNSGKDEYGSVSEVEHTLNGSTRNTSSLLLEQDGDSMPGIVKKGNISILDGENADSTEPLQSQKFQDVACTGPCQNPELLVIEELPQSKNKILDVGSGNLGAQRLQSSMEYLQEELEKMKNDNKSFSISHNVDPDLQFQQREIMKLHKANEELGSMFPFFNENPDGGNAVERVLAFEIELAEALKAKNKSNIIFQSSLLKQSDEEVVLKSFRDINKLIKELLGLKERHSALEAELRQMHDSYSQLSLQFAEVEGERQKLEMTLKNTRTFRKFVALNP
ncbi:hypothetical protein OROGR_021239 [Orobanche gracilis]